MSDLAHLTFDNNKYVRTATILRILSTSAASSFELFDLDKADVVDPLQFFAAKTGLVESIGQDAVQAIIAAPFVSIAVLESA
jgi:hypothetical protein